MQSPNTQDRTEIYELYARYSWALDTGDTDGYVALFTEDAEATEETSSGAIEVREGRALLCLGDNQPSARTPASALVRACATHR